VLEQFDKYENFIFDVWGVLYNGEFALDGVIELIDIINKQNKNIFLLSNAPRPSYILHDKMKSIGVTVPESNIMTSGQYYLDMLSAGNFNEKTYLVGHNKYPLDPIIDNVNLVDKPEDAENLLFLGFGETSDEIEYYQQILKNLIKYNLRFICINPDVVVMHGDKEVSCQGFFSKYYEDLGGEVAYLGKPYIGIYDHLFSKFNLAKETSVMLGDSLKTDILGANDFGIDSILVNTGVHKHETSVANLAKKYSIEPKYKVNNLRDLYEDNATVCNIR